MTIGRNDPCTCGSGKKYKKCCRERDEEQARARLRAANEEQRKREMEMHALEMHREKQQARREAIQRAHDELRADLRADVEALDTLSNSVLDHLREQRYDAALAACDRLLREYPDTHDAYERPARVHDALGNHALAADLWEKAVAVCEHPDVRDDYDEGLIEDYRQRMAAATERAAAAAAEAKAAPSGDHEPAP